MNARPRKTFLHLVHRFPYPPDKGDRIRAFHILKFLARQGAVHVACLADEPITDEALAGLWQNCDRLAVVPIGKGRWARAACSFAAGRSITEGAFKSAGLQSIIRQWTRDTRYDVVLASASSMVPYLHLKDLRSTPAIVDLVDVDSQKWFDYAANRHGFRSWIFRAEGHRLRRLEKDLPTWARAVILAGEAEAAIYRQFCAPGNVYPITNGVDLNHFGPRDHPFEPSCVFVGVLDYHPNVDGITWFCEAVWPGVRQRMPKATLRLVGRKPVEAIMRLSNLPGVEVIGAVPDVVPEIARAGIVVVPLRIARGVQNKVLEALAMGKATIASPAALGGVRATPGKHLVAASTPAEWVETIVRLFHNAELRDRLGAAGRRYVEKNHVWDACLAPLETLIGSDAPSRGRQDFARVSVGGER